MSLLSIVIPAHNEQDNIPSTLRSIPAERLRALGVDVEIVVVDNASTDDTAAVARSLGANVVTVTNSRGPYYARQLAASESRADILLFTDGRCRPLPGLLDAHRLARRDQPRAERAIVRGFEAWREHGGAIGPHGW